MLHEEKLIKLIADVLDVAAASINSSTELAEIGVDSLKFIQLVVTLENEYNFTFDDNDLLLEKFQSINDLLDYVYRKCNDTY